MTYLADVENILENGSVSLHHHDVFGNIGIKEFFSLHLAGLDDDDDLPLDLVEGGDVGSEVHGISARWVHEDVSLVKVAPELLKSVPNRHKQQIS